MSRKNHRKEPKAYVSPTEHKTPKAGIFPSDSGSVEFKAEQMDMEGPLGWNAFDSCQIQIVFQKIFESQKLTWQELRNNKSHLVTKDQLCVEAQKRLIKIKKDDLDELYSLRLTGRQRIWGIKEGNIFWILWWDPNHEVCPSQKKHT